MNPPTKHLPPENAESAPFWEGCRAGELRLQYCPACQRYQFYPRILCTACGHRKPQWRAVSGAGKVTTFTIVRRAVSAAYEADVPYVVALVELAEGPVMMSNIVGCEAEAVFTGMPVRVVFAAFTDEVMVPQFQPGES